jgi:2-polyprenyl-3-methyl-5-hydroxy-6-metoxy-1,4-benzoquinol methylase
MDLLERSDSNGHRHPWERARLDVVERLIRRTRLQSPRVLDVGCGDGFAIRGLRNRLAFGRTVGLDANLTESECRDGSSSEMEFVSTLPDPPTERFDLLLLLDVLEHIEESDAFLRALIRERLEPGGCALITAPAYQALSSRHDRRLRHFRRYDRKHLVREAESAGLTVTEAGYFIATLLPLRALAVLWERLRGGAAERADDGGVGVGTWRHGEFATRAIAAWLRSDAMMCLAAQRVGVHLPGLSVWASCRKP